MSDKNILISDIYDLKELKKQLEDVVTNLKSSISSIDAKIDEKEQALLEQMKLCGVDVDKDVENLVAAIFKKENIGYTSDSAVLDYLKANNRSDLIKVKVTESLDKVALKKALKTDAALSESLEAMTVHSITEYVVVTSEANYEKMLEHINEGSNK